MMQGHTVYTALTAKDIMSQNPITLSDTVLAKEALLLMKQNEISQVIVTQNDNYCGIVHIHDILNEGIY